MRRSLVFATPDLFGPIGGIARISRAMTLALAQWAESHDISLQVHVLHDRAGPPDDRYFTGAVVYHPHGGRRASLVRALTEAAWRRGHVATIFGHIHLAVAGLLHPPTTPQALVAHGIEIWEPFPVVRVDRQLALRRQNAIWAISQHTSNRVRASHHIPPAKLHVVPNGLDPFWPEPDDLCDASATATPSILATCSLARGFEYKGIDRVLAALAAIPTAARPHFDVVGDGDDRPRLEALALQLGVASSVQFHGRIDDLALSRLHRTATAFVLPSTHEGFGLVFLEAMAWGLPVITANAGAAPEVVHDGVTGLVVPPHDTAALAAAISRLTTDGTFAHALGANGRAEVAASHRFEHYARAVHAALDRLIRA